MSAINRVLRSVEGGRFMFWCPGCNEAHVVGPTWAYNGNPDAPTFSPSILVRSGHYYQPDKQCWCSHKEQTGEDPPFKCFQCHSFVRDGQIEFLSDCTHALAGKTVPLPDWPDAWD